ncbi:hypothetical protein LguiA_026993 [Lonicera macranthoides]
MMRIALLLVIRSESRGGCGGGGGGGGEIVGKGMDIQLPTVPPSGPSRVEAKLDMASYIKQVSNCCKGGILPSMSQDPDKYLAAFQMNIGAPNSDGSIPGMLVNFTLGLPGYTCGDQVEVEPSKFYEDQGRRRKQALGQS